MGTFGGKNDLAVTVIWQFIFISIIFDMMPMKNLIMIPAAIIFIFCSYITKDNIKARIVSIGGWTDQKQRQAEI